MRQLAYTSLACKPFVKVELLQLLQQARSFNIQNDITGILLYKNQSFFQVIEGEDRIIEDLMISISNDYRHYNVSTLYNRDIVSRNFNLWSMGYINIDESEIDLQGWNSVNFQFPLQNVSGNLSELVNIATAKKLVLRFTPPLEMRH